MMRRMTSGGTQVAVIGAGSWGTTVASLAAHNVPTLLWARNADLAREINNAHTNGTYLAGYELHPDLRATHDLEAAVASADIVIMGVPSHGFRSVLLEVAAYIRPGTPVVSLTKGVEQGTLLRMTQVVAEVLPGHPVGVLSGPNLAKEVMAGHPAASVIAMAEEDIAVRVQAAISSPTFRLYSNPDLVGAEIGGAFKNVIAVAAGMVDGMGFGDNTKATLITRGLGELARLGSALGGRILTFGGLAGLGDLIATCNSPQSRNRFVGEQLGRGHTIDEIVTEMNMVAEGVKSCGPVDELAKANGLDLPIVEQVAAVVLKGVTAADAMAALLARPVTTEMTGMAG